MGRVTVPATIAALAVVLSSPAPAGAADGLFVSDGPRSPPLDTVVLRAEKPGAKASAVVFLRTTGTAPVEGVQLVMPVLTSTDGVAVGATDLAIQANSAPGPASGITVPGRPGAVAVQITVTTPDRAGVYTGRLFAGQRGRYVRLAAVSLQVEPLVELVGVGAEGIKLEPRTADVARTITVRSRADEKLTLHFDAEPLTGPNSQQQALKLEADGAPIRAEGVELAAGSSVRLTVSTSAPLAGAYTSTLIVRYGGTRLVVPISITHTREAPTIELLNIDRLRHGIDFWPPWGSEQVTFTAVLHETAGDSYLANFALPKFVRQEGESDSRPDISRRSFSVGGNPPPFVVGPDANMDVRVDLGRLGPGSYTGTLRVQVAGRPAVDTPFALTVRRSAWVAALLIGFGMLAALLLRTWVGGVGLSVRRRAALTQLERQLSEAQHEAVDDFERWVSKRLGRAVIHCRRVIASEAVADADARIRRLGRRVELFNEWRPGWRHVNGLPNNNPGRDQIQPLKQIGDELGDDKDTAGEIVDLDEISMRLSELLDKLDLERPEAVKTGATAQAIDEPHLSRAANRQRLWSSIVGINWLKAQYRLGATLAWGILFVFAVALGLQVLWQNEPSWGDFGDVVAAVLWGAGLQQVGGVAFQGLLGLRDKIGAPAATS